MNRQARPGGSATGLFARVGLTEWIEARRDNTATKPSRRFATTFVVAARRIADSEGMMTRSASAGDGAGLVRSLAPFVDPLPLPPRRVIVEPTRLTIRLQAAMHQFHRGLPPSRVWTYDGQLPGPTVEVRRGVPVEVQWDNRLEGRLPVTVVRAPSFEVDGLPVQCVPGRSGGVPDADAAALPGFAVPHLHGGLTHATSDGWTENLALPGQSTLDSYPNGQCAAMLWYHDHVMGVTRFSVYAGLAGLWIVRDERERELGLPEGPPYEVPLLLADRNFDVGADGRLTGELLHKTDPEVMECFSPFTVVNGAIWPVVEVEPTTYRFRLLNGSNARTYRLVVTRDGAPDHQRITQIGTDGGLLLGPASLPAEGLVLGSAERVDLLVDFSDLAPGVELTVWNTAAAPFDGTRMIRRRPALPISTVCCRSRRYCESASSRATWRAVGYRGAGDRFRAGDPRRARRPHGSCRRPRRTSFRRRGRAANADPPRARRGAGRCRAGHRRRRATRGWRA